MSGNYFTLPSFAKVNLLLRVLGKRNDGFHEICTIFQTVSLHDSLIFSEHKKLTLTCDDKKIPTDARNLIVKAAEILRGKFGIKKGAKIHLEKNIPAPGGLGGGSSNAATALVGLVQLWNIKVKMEDLCELGEKLGCDVPFFFFGGTAVGIGSGTEIFPITDFTAKYMIIVKPNVDISTKKAFAELKAPDLTNKTSKSILQICRDEANSLCLRQSKLKNDFEKTIFELEPETARAKEKLFGYGAKRALMSGSGASVYGIFDNDLKRQNAFNVLQTEQNWRVFSVETISRLDYRNFLKFDKILLDKDF
ncbi:4-(cytidine 5'-diphospho)-2-C-methyl-D-erythritol kinase [soil metagenome]|jgi:4-diphosphocytidyl-2-C-methyl-D-erythritol kinase|nr:4-(cytidine 5'-diphospho)-2-C-methyl-D-erythritol kinase [Pyrinomonadaceae bacterium]